MVNKDFERGKLITVEQEYDILIDGDGPCASNPLPKKRQAALICGPVIAMLFLFNPAPENMTPEAWRSVSLATWMVIWWLGEAMPITATALLTATLMPLFGFAQIMQANKYMNTVPLNC